MADKRDHGGGLDAAVAQYGGTREGWLDLSTGINPVPYPVGQISADAWGALPDHGAMARLIEAARRFWNVPEDAVIVPANGASALIARLPALPVMGAARDVQIATRTYNEHAAAFASAGWTVGQDAADVRVVVHPNNPDGALMGGSLAAVTVIDESFCDVCPDESQMRHADRDGVIVLKSFGKFWGLAGVRLGFAMGTPRTVGPLVDMLGPWAVAGPALEIGARALRDEAWAARTRERLATDAARLDAMMTDAGAQVIGGTDLFRLYDVMDAAAWQDRLARGHVWSRVFPYDGRWLRLGLPALDRWDQLEAAL
ncbi:threonine-phosphate decarboxylase [Nereida sp. MMG025]|uniref:threonine-phosphate decarboxylase n=1 Tax=Nereida sp. MMG025 TaxID=2909981 RepID=UPI001F27A6BC|nr:threonine-phosphate decarboxylase [Nereida sp. MMG025]MCF6444908.1 pyridoxal phosphate-dependent class II aminotransferase [Nereida sp. MMG025]